MDLVLMVGPLANVEIEGKRVPPKAISTSFGGCLELDRKHKKWKKKKMKKNPAEWSWKKWAQSNSTSQCCCSNFVKVRTSSMRIFKTSGIPAAALLLNFVVKYPRAFPPPLFFFFKVSARRCYNRSRYILPLMGRRFEGNTHSGLDAEAREREDREAANGGIPPVGCHAGGRQYELRKPHVRFP